ncbi:MAG: putative plasmid stabilization protein [Rhizobium sp.]|nr:putative plasmid stabilization protein [Rhizobium sp.]
MIVVMTDEADADFERIGDTIAEDNPRRSSSFVRELVQRCERLADMPRRFSLLPGHEHTNIRRLVHGEYLIFYRVDPDAVYILRILNGAMDYEQVLFPEE